MDEKTVLVFGIIAFKLYLDNRVKLNEVIKKKREKVVKKRAEKKAEVKPVKLEGFKIGN